VVITGSRAPCGARGLKRVPQVADPADRESCPVWGAWIETCSAPDKPESAKSRPVWGAWIETVSE